MRLRRRTRQGRVRREAPAPQPVTIRPPAPPAPRAEPPQPAPERGRHNPSWLQRAGLIILSLAALASAANVLSLSPGAKVVPLTGSDSSLLRAPEVYEAAADRQLGRSIWNRNKITVNTSTLSRQLLKEFPELRSVSVTVPLLAHRPVVYVEPAQPVLVLVAANGAFIVDNAGKALLRNDNPHDFSRLKLPILNDQSGLRINVNRQALPAGDIRFIQIIVAQLAAKQFTVSDMTLPAGTSELDVKLAGQPYMVKFNLQSDKAKEQAGTFLAAMAELRRQNITPRYVDVRVDGRAYYQ